MGKAAEVPHKAAGKCPYCGAESLLATVVERAPAVRVPGTKKALGIIPTALVASHALACLDCGHVSFFLDKAELQAAQRNSASK